MGVSFSYHTKDPISPDLKVKICDEAKLLNERNWSTTEGIIFFEMEGFQDKLYGDSKVFMDDENIEEEHDMVFIINCLKS